MTFIRADPRHTHPSLDCRSVSVDGRPHHAANCRLSPAQLRHWAAGRHQNYTAATEDIRRQKRQNLVAKSPSTHNLRKKNRQMVADSVSTILASIRFYADETDVGEHTLCCQELLPPLRGVGSAALEFFWCFCTGQSLLWRWLFVCHF